MLYPSLPMAVRNGIDKSMRWLAFTACVAFGGAAWPASALAPLADPVALNIGINCQWQKRCVSKQPKAMKQALKFIKKRQPPMWRVNTCNRNAARGRSRVDWVGFDNCIRNSDVRPVVVRAPRKRTKHAAPAAAAARASRGERG
jgi:hypothetical protein